MATFIQAHLQDMDTCRKSLDTLDEDIRSILKSVDSFLNTRGEMNGQAIFANWQSKARDLFIQKTTVVLDSLESIANECNNASAILTTAINSYSESDKEVAGIMNAVEISPINFHFGDGAGGSKLDKIEATVIPTSIQHRDYKLSEVHQR